MIKEAVIHENTKRFVHTKGRNQLTFCIQTAKSDIKECYIHYFARTNPENEHILKMQLKYRDGRFDYYEKDVYFSKVARYQKYYFEIIDNEETTYYLNPHGVSTNKPDVDFFEYLYANEGDVVSFPQWTKGQIFYQIFPERFCDGDSNNNPEGTVPWGTMPTRENFMGGDLIGIEEKIPYLKELGVECLYFNPIFKSEFNHKYATEDYFDIDPIFGTKEDFARLVKKLHEADIRIILDGVFNHTGIHFKPFEDVLENQENSIYKDWFYLTKFPVTVTHHDYECVGAYKWMPKLNATNPKVREYILSVMEYWIENYHIDGWRLDVADEVDPRVWSEARIRLKEKYPNILLLGETWGLGLNLLDDKLDSVMNYLFRDLCRDYFAYEKIDEKELDARLNYILATYYGEGKHLLYNLLDSHDTERFLYFSNGDKRKLKQAVALQMLFVGSPAIYYGDEIGLTGANDPDCRRAMEWDKDKQDLELFEYYKQLIKLRKEEKCIRTGEYQTIICSSEEKLFGFVRYKDEDKIYVVFNNSNKEQKVSIPAAEKGKYKNLLTNADVLEYEGEISINTKPYSVNVIKQM